MDTFHVSPRYGKHAQGIIVAQIGFDGEGELRQIAQILDVIGMNTCRVKSLF